MLRLPKFTFERPNSVEAALDLLATHGTQCKVIAGGTDLLPNMKHGLFEPEVVVGLSGIDELRGVQLRDDGSIVVGAMTTLEEVEHDETIRRMAPGLAQAAGSVAGPSQRSMGTLGGNVCLDTRCVWYNQTFFWRKALGYCLKKDGTVCHVVEGGKRCVAAASNDAGTMLVALDATLVIRKAGTSRSVPIRQFYHPDGQANLKLDADELLTQIIVPGPASGHHSGYSKLRPRQSIDFPKLSVAVVYAVDDAGLMTDATLVLSAIAAVPRLVRGVSEMAKGRRPDDPEFLAELGEKARKATHPLTNIDGDTDYRKEVIPVFVRRAFASAGK